MRIGKGQPTHLALRDDQEVDFVSIRESTVGLFHTQSTGHVTDDLAQETLQITRATSEKLFKFAFDLAASRKKDGHGNGHVTCVDKANVFRAVAFFRSIFDEVAQDYPNLSADHAYVDATALWMVERPETFDVMATENMFGDILSDLGAGLMGGSGMAPSADIGDQNAVSQPCHGSAPDIAGKNIANPFAMILSAAMMLDWLGTTAGNSAVKSDAKRLQTAVESTVAAGRDVTRDLGGTASTQEATNAVMAAL